MQFLFSEIRKVANSIHLRDIESVVQDLRDLNYTVTNDETCQP